MWKARTKFLELSSLPAEAHASRKLESNVDPRIEPRYSDMQCGNPTCVLIIRTNVALDKIFECFKVKEGCITDPLAFLESLPFS